ncbi:MAG: hypothetical protein HQM09_04870 [Candidatus Riflebacteria bacterium]|nr:hypothetical protein [Candidatus Riflebacteria bacterium]
MTRRAFTIVEVSIALLILTLLIYSVTNLLMSSGRQYVHQEESVMCTVEASNLISILRKDFEQCIASGKATDSFLVAKSAISFKDEVLRFSVAGKNSSSFMQYIFESQNKVIRRQNEGQDIPLAKGLITYFFAALQILGDDNVIRSYPCDPEKETPDPPFPAKPIKAVRVWIKIFMTLEGKGTGKIPVKQKYVFRVFPQRLNRQLQSIWYVRD